MLLPDQEVHFGFNSENMQLTYPTSPLLLLQARPLPMATTWTFSLTIKLPDIIVGTWLHQIQQVASQKCAMLVSMCRAFSTSVVAVSENLAAHRYPFPTCVAFRQHHSLTFSWMGIEMPGVGVNSILVSDQADIVGTLIPSGMSMMPRIVVGIGVVEKRI